MADDASSYQHVFMQLFHHSVFDLRPGMRTMTDNWDSDIQRRKFAEERSHRDAEVSNENIRATAQAVILINGGAATALLAFLAKDKLDPDVLKSASLCLAGYAFGVMAGAGMLYCSMRSLGAYQMSWRLRAHPEVDESPERAAKEGYRWWKGVRNCFYVSVLTFFVTCCAVGWILARSTPPQQIPSAIGSAPAAASPPQPPAAR
jgi:hypothetical protein